MRTPVSARSSRWQDGSDGSGRHRPVVDLAMENFGARLSRGLVADARARQNLNINMADNMVMIRVNLAEAKAKFSAYVNRVEEGQTVVICRRNVPVAELRPVTQPAADQRPVGIDRGMEIPDSVVEPLPADLVEAFEGATGDE